MSDEGEKLPYPKPSLQEAQGCQTLFSQTLLPHVVAGINSCRFKSSTWLNWQGVYLYGKHRGTNNDKH